MHRGRPSAIVRSCDSTLTGGMNIPSTSKRCMRDIAARHSSTANAGASKPLNHSLVRIRASLATAVYLLRSFHSVNAATVLGYGEVPSAEGVNILVGAASMSVSSSSRDRLRRDRVVGRPSEAKTLRMGAAQWGAVSTPARWRGSAVKWWGANSQAARGEASKSGGCADLRRSDGYRRSSLVDTSSSLTDHRCDVARISGRTAGALVEPPAYCHARSRGRRLS